MAYKKEIHEIIETDYDEEDDSGEETVGEEVEGEVESVSKPKPIVKKSKPRPVKRYRKTKIKVVEEEE